MTVTPREALVELTQRIVESLGLPDDQLHHPDLLSVMAKAFEHMASGFRELAKESNR